MADSSQLRKLVAYNQWAYDKILTAIDGMTAEELARPGDAYFGPIGGNLHHALWATRDRSAHTPTPCGGRRESGSPVGEARCRQAATIRSRARGARPTPRPTPTSARPWSRSPLQAPIALYRTQTR